MAYRAAVAGCGLIGSEFSDTVSLPGIWSHAEAYRNCESLELVSFCDKDPGKLEGCLKRWGVSKGYSDFEAMLKEENPEFVSICTPDAAHFAMINRALEYPSVKAVLAEKPLAMNLDEAKTLVKLARERNVLLAVNYSRRYAPGFQKLKERIDSGFFGKIQAVSGFYTKGVLHNGTHWLDLANFLMGPAAMIRAFDRLREGGNDPTLDVLLEFANGASGSLLGCDAKAFAVFEMDIMGTSGRARIVDSGVTIEIHQAVQDSVVAGYRRLNLVERFEGCLGSALPSAISDLVQCIEKGGRPRSSGESAVEALALGLAAIDSAKA